MRAPESCEMCSITEKVNSDYNSLFQFGDLKITPESHQKRRRKLRRDDMGDILNLVGEINKTNHQSTAELVVEKLVEILTYLAIAGDNHRKYKKIPQENFYEAIGQFLEKNEGNTAFTSKFSTNDNKRKRRFR